MFSYIKMLTITLGMVIITMGTVFGAEVQLVKIVGEKNRNLLILEPQELTINKKTVVIWTNGSNSGQVMVVFEDGKNCLDVVVDPDGRFNLDKQQVCFVTSFMPFGATSSLIFPETGKFQYKVISEDGELKTRGSITVK